MKQMYCMVTVLVFLCSSVCCGVAAADQNTPAALKIALVHFAVTYRDIDKNLAELTALHRTAACQGAKIIFNTELALSGYSFSSRADVAPMTRTLNSRAVRHMAALARELGVYIGITFPEKDEATGSFYNSAVVLSPEGQMICHYRKIYGEKRWARSGSPYQKNVFDTPWGRMGVAICADSYFGLILRTAAVQGADLLWVPANWPPTGSMSPLDVWQTRARENGMYLAACNRTGKDRTMDCTSAVSAVINPEGTVMEKTVSGESTLMVVQIPLKNGRIDSVPRQQRMASRKIAQYRQIYLDPWTENLTAYYQLPEPGRLQVRCIVPHKGPLNMAALENEVKQAPAKPASLWVLPQVNTRDLPPDALISLARKYGTAFAVRFSDHGPELITAKGRESFLTHAPARPFPFDIRHLGPAAVAMVPMAELYHPELSVILSKLGCDLVLLSELALSSADMVTGSVRTIDNLAVAGAGKDSGFVAHMKGIHGKLTTNRISGSAGVCSFDLDTAQTREKTFYDRIDYDLLLTFEKGGK
jgi:predicted amidohydrolase